MAQKKQTLLEQEFKDADLMTILSSGGNSKVFRKNDIIDFSYPTGIWFIDYALGYEINIRDGIDGPIVGKRICLGLQAGTFNVLTGATQSYKTTLGIQMCKNIAFTYSGNIRHYDVEQRLVMQRAKDLTGLPDSWFAGDNPRYAIRYGAIGFDTLQEDITEIWRAKMGMKNVLLADTGLKDDHNQPIKMMPPTVLFLDSLSDVIAREYDINDAKTIENVSELRTDTYGMRSAKTLRGMLTDVLPMLKEANILFICIAHKGANVAMNAFAGPKKQFQYGSHDEKMSGGKVVEYSASSVLNLTGEIKEDSRYHLNTDGFEGNTVLFEPIKVSTNESGNEKSGRGFRLVIDKQLNGIDNIRSMILYLYSKGKLKGNKAGYRIINSNGEPISEKFTWKTVYDDFKKDPATYKTFMLLAKEELEKLISRARSDEPTMNVFDIDTIISGL